MWLWGGGGWKCGRVYEPAQNDEQSDILEMGEMGMKETRKAGNASDTQKVEGCKIVEEKRSR